MNIHLFIFLSLHVYSVQVAECPHSLERNQERMTSSLGETEYNKIVPTVRRPDLRLSSNRPKSAIVGIYKNFKKLFFCNLRLEF